MVTTAMVVSPCGTRVPFLVVSPPVDSDLAPAAYGPLPAGRPGPRPYSALASYGNRRANSTSEKVVGPSLGHRTVPDEIHKPWTGGRLSPARTPTGAPPALPVLAGRMLRRTPAVALLLLLITSSPVHAGSPDPWTWPL